MGARFSMCVPVKRSHTLYTCTHEPCRLIHGSILPFTQQGLEKLNDAVTKNFFRSSCHRDEALKQLIEKQNRIEHLNDAGKKRAKLFEVECSNCSKHGHNRLTCSEPCKHCGQCYCNHLVSLGGQRVPQCQQEN